MRRLAVVCGWVLVAVLGYLAVNLALVWRTSSGDQARPAEAIVVMGAAQYEGRPSRVFQARLDHAVTLYDRGLAPVLVVTGGRQRGDSVSESNTAYNYLRGQGVPDTALRQEVDGTTSYESLAASARFLAAEGIDEVILVSDGWHLERSVAIARDVGLRPLPSPTPTSPYSSLGALRQMVREAIGVAAGRVIGFRRLDRLSTLAAGGEGPYEWRAVLSRTG